MSNGTGNLAAAEDAKQVENRRGTGLSEREELLQAAELIGESAAGWRESGQIPVLLLRALTELTLSSPDGSEQGFTADALAARLAVVRGKSWLPTGLDKEETNRRVREQWNKLTETIWPSKLLGLRDRTEESGLVFRAKLDRLKGGGTGHQTRYRLVLDTAAQPADSFGQADGYAQYEEYGDIRYVREDFENAGRWLRFLFGKVSLKGWRLGIFLLLIAVAMGISGLLLFLLGISVWYQLSPKVIAQLTISTAVILWLIWSELGPVLNLPSKRITFAPSWIQVLRWDSDVLLECCAPPRYDSKFISAVHYIGICPVCSGKVAIESGGVRYFGRLIGRCRESPREHVFSFDHVTRSGRRLG